MNKITLITFIKMKNIVLIFHDATVLLYQINAANVKHFFENHFNVPLVTFAANTTKFC